MTQKKKVLIIGAGPAGLTAGVELSKKAHIQPHIVEATPDLGGISRTVDYNGNKLDIGGHRFFTKSDRINDWWDDILPMEDGRRINPDETDEIMLVRDRLSRIYYLSKLFNYPIQLKLETFKNLGLLRSLKIAASYTKSRLSEKKAIRTLEDLFIHKFGKELYNTFFKSYTEKVWGVPCHQIKPEWGSQRIKNLSVTKTILHALKERYSAISGTRQRSTETSLISRFRYPKFGPGQFWEKTAERFQDSGGVIERNQRVVALNPLFDGTFSVTVENPQTGRRKDIPADCVVSTMPVKELVSALDTEVPQEVKDIADGLVYRDFLIVGLLLENLKRKIPDQWIYIQEPFVKMGRLQIFNNWSPYMTRDRSRAWVGAEFFCNEGDSLWNLSDAELISMSADELSQMHFIDRSAVLDGVVVRQAKAYPAYFGTYDQFHVLRQYLDRFSHLYLIGRNGMHRYNNMDHSMMTGILAAEAISEGHHDKEKIWEINTQDELHE